MQFSDRDSDSGIDPKLEQLRGTLLEVPCLFQVREKHTWKERNSTEILKQEIENTAFLVLHTTDLLDLSIEVAISSMTPMSLPR